MGARGKDRGRSGSADELASLRKLAKACGIQTRYTDGLGQKRTPPPESLLAILKALGHPVRRASDADRALDRLERDREREMLPPVIVAWDGDAPAVRVNPPKRGRKMARTLEWSLELEDGGGEYRSSQSITGEPVKLRLPRGMPTGYHTLAVEAGGERAIATVLAAPARCYDTRDEGAQRELGIFLPLYAARSQRDWGIGDLRELEALTTWAGGLGCNLIGTLPLLACYLDEPFEPSPYAPVSRLHFNELFVDIVAAPELRESAAARRLVNSPAFKRKLESLRKADMVDYRDAWQAKKRALALLAAAALRSPERRAAIEELMADDPTLLEYAQFRAAAERRGTTWQGWPARARDGQLRASDYDKNDLQRHLYAQLLMREQLAEQSRLARERGGRLYLDLPLGTHGGGFDLWRFREHFAPTLSTGAPPDVMFTHGQNWGFPPLHPENARLLGHKYFALAIRNHLRYAGALRIDHVAGLHRLFVIPEGAAGEDGAYITYRHEEFYAILSIESHRAKARIIGENLGTVPQEVTQQMNTRGVLGMWVGQFNIPADPRRAVPPVGEMNLACLNTHDIPPFAAHWKGEDITLRRGFGWIDEAGAADEHAGRERWRTSVIQYLKHRRLLPKNAAHPEPEQIALALLQELAAGDAEIVLVNLEDLWGETRSQNVPGTTTEHANWQRKAARTIESITADPALAKALTSLARARGHPGPKQRNVQPQARTRKSD